MEYVAIAAVVVLLLILYSARVTAKTRVWVIRLRAGVPFLV